MTQRTKLRWARSSPIHLLEGDIGNRRNGISIWKPQTTLPPVIAALATPRRHLEASLTATVQENELGTMNFHANERADTVVAIFCRFESQHFARQRLWCRQCVRSGRRGIVQLLRRRVPVTYNFKISFGHSSRIGNPRGKVHPIKIMRLYP